jgi:flagellar hook-associated protein 1 FlgK
MGDMLNTAVSGLMAFQEALDTTSNNISNVDTPGYSREAVDLVSVPGAQTGTISIGNGVSVSTVQRIFNQTVASQLVSATASYNQLNAFSTQAAQIDNLLGSTTGGLSTQLQSLVSAIQGVSDAPTSSASRQALIGQAQQLVSTLQNDDGSLQSLGSQVNQQLSSDASQVSSLAQSIASLNQQIAANSSPSAPAPNTLLDERNQLINQLASYVNVNTTVQSNGAMNVYIGTGQALVIGSTSANLVASADAYDPSQDELSLQSGQSSTDVTQQITGGTLGGTLQFRSQMLQPAQNGLGQIALVLANAMNTQNQSGLDQSGNLGQAMFAVGGVGVLPNSGNTGTASVAATVTDANAVTTDDYVLQYSGSAWSLRDASSGASVPMSGAGTSASPFSAVGLSLVVSGTAQAGDSYRIDPTSGVVSGMSVLLTDSSQVAAAAPLVTAAASTNTGSGTIDQGAVVAGYTPDNYTLTFTGADTYQVVDDTSGATVIQNGSYSAGSPIGFNGITVSIAGAPAQGDSFSIDDNSDGSGDNRNANAMAGLLDQPLIGGTTSINGAFDALVTNIGIQTSQAQTGTTAQQALLTDATNAQQSVSGVNLDEEAANMVQYQQAYEAAAEVVKTAATLFQSLLSAVQSG